MLKACSAEVRAPESTLTLMAGMPSVGKAHHSSLPMINLFSGALISVPA